MRDRICHPDICLIGNDDGAELFVWRQPVDRRGARRAQSAPQREGFNARGNSPAEESILLLSETIAQRADDHKKAIPANAPDHEQRVSEGYLPYLDNAPDCGGQEIAVLIGYHQETGVTVLAVRSDWSTFDV